MSLTRIFGAPFVFLLLGFPLHAHDYKAGDIVVDQPWAMPLPPVSVNGAAYLDIKNLGQNPDMLMAADSPIAEKIEVHEHIHENGVMKMQEMAGGLELKAGATVKFVPGGLHLMLIGLKEPLVEGETFPVNLQFEQAGSLEVIVHIQQKDAGALPGDEAHTGHNMEQK